MHNVCEIGDHQTNFKCARDHSASPTLHDFAAEWTGFTTRNCLLPTPEGTFSILFGMIGKVLRHSTMCVDLVIPKRYSDVLQLIEFLPTLQRI